MDVYMWVIVAVFSLLTAAYIVCKLTKVNNNARGVVKMVLSTLFVAVGAVGLGKLNAAGATTPLAQYGAILICGLVFAFMGDFFLIFMEKSRPMFIAGVLAFSAASFTFACYSVLMYGFNAWSILVIAVLVVVNTVCQIVNVYRFGSMVVYVNIYTAFVCVCGAFGLLVLCTVSGTHAILFGLGAFLYLLSDIVLGLYLFRFKYPWVTALNSALYFPGLMLIALSLLF